ncbi:alpha/beta-hydrolase [Dacryopinax primogenitus]|uniref:Alpha/beta-hydrolase n=1 Tax=Dacryopinax primogenitus (strain DJM 731) TaxID=1858805 RepID=M5GAM6_DACPD|nr:alpha/beta-hydrolase [Dacryopinax primogenitus]EJU03017.1 alpha/beta-hydrolase [Dacryopinax primogenitus]
MTSPSLTSLALPPFALLKRLITALSLTSLPAAVSATAQPEHRSIWESLGDGVKAVALRWRWRTTLLEQVESSSTSLPPHIAFSRSHPSNTHPKPPKPPKHSPPPPSIPPTPLYKLYFHPLLFDPLRCPRLPIILCHGLYGFDVKGPSSFPALQSHYWDRVLKVLRGKVGAEVVCPAVPGTGSIIERAEKMHAFLREKLPGREVNFIAHSMGGLDCRHLITHLQPREYTPRSLLTISTPHRGSPVMDWCAANIGVGTALSDAPLPPPPLLPFSLKSPLLTRLPSSTKLTLTLSSLPSSLTSLLLNMVDSPAYANLTTSYLEHSFNPSTPDSPQVKYFSIAARVGQLSILHPLWLPKLLMDAAASLTPDGDEGNDGLVGVKSAKWGEYLGSLEDCDHWEVRGTRGLVRAWEIWGKGEEGKGRGTRASDASTTGNSNSNNANANKERHAHALAHRLTHTLQQNRAELLSRAHELREEALALESQGRMEREERGAVERFGRVLEWVTEGGLGLGGGGSEKGLVVDGGGNGSGLEHMGSGSPSGDEPIPLPAPAASSRPNTTRVAHTTLTTNTNTKATQASQGRAQQEEWRKLPAFDMERFYVALSRKLYDEGL